MTKLEATNRRHRRADRRERDKAARSLAALVLAGQPVDSPEVLAVLEHFVVHAKRIEVHADLVDAIVEVR